MSETLRFRVKYKGPDSSGCNYSFVIIDSRETREPRNMEWFKSRSMPGMKLRNSVCSIPQFEVYRNHITLFGWGSNASEDESELVVSKDHFGCFLELLAARNPGGNYAPQELIANMEEINRA